MDPKCNKSGEQTLITVANKALIGWFYWKPTLYVRGLADGNGRMFSHKSYGR